MRTAALPSFRKLWGRIEQDLQPGKYTILIGNNYDVSPFEGKKYFAVSTANAFGGKNIFLGVSYIVIGGITLIITVIFIIKFYS